MPEPAEPECCTLDEVVDGLAGIWPLDVGLLLLPTGMVAVLTGNIDDGYGGLLGCFWCERAGYVAVGAR